MFIIISIILPSRFIFEKLFEKELLMELKLDYEKDKIEQFSYDKTSKIVENVVNRFYYQNKIPLKEKDDIIQDILHKYITQQNKIKDSFKGNSKYETYLTAIFYKMCCEVIRSEKKNWHYHEQDLNIENQNVNVDFVNEEDKLIIKSEIEYLKIILELFDQEKMKVVIFLKHYYRLLILIEELSQYHPDYKSLSLDKLLLKIAESKSEVFENLAQVVNLVENKNIKSDAVRIWLNNKIERMIKILNNSRYKSNYDKNSFQILFEYAFANN